MAFRFLSWNLDTFGKYNYSGSMSRIAQTIIDSGADVVVILEVFANRSVKKARIGEDLVLPGAVTALSLLLQNLQKKDGPSGWKQTTSGTNCGGKQRDAYAFYWKSTPKGTLPAGFVLPTQIKLIEGPMILRDGPGGTEPAFKGSRRPGACHFQMTNAAVTGSPKDVLICGFHAYAALKDITGLKNCINDCITVAETQANLTGVAMPVVIGGDLNLDYSSNKTFYGSLQNSYITALTDGVGTSLKANPDFSVPDPVVADNAYDNFLFKGLTVVASWPAKVINVVDNIADSLPQKIKNKKRSRGDLEQEAFAQYHTKDSTSTSSISDHFPIVGAFGF